MRSGEIVRYYAGEERTFRLLFGDVRTLENVLDTPIGVIGQRVLNGAYFLDDVLETLRIGLISGGLEPPEAKKLTNEAHDLGLSGMAGIVADLIESLMVGIEHEAQSSEKPQKIRFTELAQLAQVMAVSPVDLNTMTYADVCNMIHGFNAAGSKNVETISDDEFQAMKKRFEEQNVGQ